MTLTEDRTLKYVWEAQAKIAAYVARSKDPKLINAVVSADAEKFFEGRLDWDYAGVSPSEEFTQVINKKKYRGGYVSPRALSYHGRYSPPVVKESRTLRQRMSDYAYSDNLDEDVKQLFQYLLKCEIKEPAPTDPNDIPF
jgi:hypothetical protein